MKKNSVNLKEMLMTWIRIYIFKCGSRILISRIRIRIKIKWIPSTVNNHFLKLFICLVKLSRKRILENGDGTRRSAGEVSSPCARRRIKRRLGRVWLKLEARHLSLGRSARPVFLSTATACPALSAIHPAHPSST